MTALDDSARASGVILLNELGLDPGIDHMSAMSLIADAREKGHQVRLIFCSCFTMSPNLNLCGSHRSTVSFLSVVDYLLRKIQTDYSDTNSPGLLEEFLPPL